MQNKHILIDAIEEAVRQGDVATAVKLLTNLRLELKKNDTGEIVRCGVLLSRCRKCKTKFPHTGSVCAAPEATCSHCEYEYPVQTEDEAQQVNCPECGNIRGVCNEIRGTCKNRPVYGGAGKCRLHKSRVPKGLANPNTNRKRYITAMRDQTMANIMRANKEDEEMLSQGYEIALARTNLETLVSNASIADEKEFDWDTLYKWINKLEELRENDGRIDSALNHIRKTYKMVNNYVEAHKIREAQKGWLVLIDKLVKSQMLYEEKKLKVVQLEVVFQIIDYIKTILVESVEEAFPSGPEFKPIKEKLIRIHTKKIEDFAKK